MSLSRNQFSLVMNSPGGPGMGNEETLPQSAMQYDDSCVVNFRRENKNRPNWCAKQS